jgi:hypothetical protein
MFARIVKLLFYFALVKLPIPFFEIFSRGKKIPSAQLSIQVDDAI